MVSVIEIGNSRPTRSKSQPRPDHHGKKKSVAVLVEGEKPEEEELAEGERPAKIPKI